MLIQQYNILIYHNWNDLQFLSLTGMNSTSAFYGLCKLKVASKNLPKM